MQGQPPQPRTDDGPPVSGWAALPAPVNPAVPP
jgi:hypothetical protein